MKRGVERMRRRFERIWRSRDTCFILGGDGILYACGDNQFGQLGLGKITKRHRRFTPVSFEGSVKEMWLSSISSFLLSTEGYLYACGHNRYGQLGMESLRHVREFERVTHVEGISGELLPFALSVKGMWEGQGSFFLSTTDGKLYASGENKEGRLGLGEYRKHSRLFGLVYFAEDKKGESVLFGGGVERAWVSEETAFLLTTEGRLYACGNNKYGQLGLQDMEKRERFEPVARAMSREGVWISLEKNVKEMWISNYTSFVLMNGGQLYASGLNDKGQLGMRDGKDRSRFEASPFKKKVKYMWAGNYDTYLLTGNSELFSCGSNWLHQLGFEDTRNRYEFDGPVDRGLERLVKGELGGIPNGEYPKYDLSVRRLQCLDKDSMSLLSTFYDCLGLLAPYIEGSPIFEEGRGVYEKKV